MFSYSVATFVALLLADYDVNGLNDLCCYEFLDKITNIGWLSLKLGNKSNNKLFDFGKYKGSK